MQVPQGLYIAGDEVQLLVQKTLPHSLVVYQSFVKRALGCGTIVEGYEVRCEALVRTMATTIFRCAPVVAVRSEAVPI